MLAQFSFEGVHRTSTHVSDALRQVIEEAGPKDTQTVVPYGLNFVGCYSTNLWDNTASTPSWVVGCSQPKVWHQSL